MAAEVLMIVLLGALPPLVGVVRGWRAAGWLYVALMPCFMYDKAIFLTTRIGGSDIQWPTLAKDATGAVLLGAMIAAFAISPPSRRLVPVGRILLVVGGFAAYWLITGLAVGGGVGHTLMGLRTYVFYTVLGLILGTVLIHGPETWERLAVVVFAGAVLLAAVALVQRYVDAQFLIHNSMKQTFAGHTVEWSSYQARLHSIFTSANVLGFFMAVGIISGVSLLQRRPWSAGGVLISLLCVPLGWVLVLTLSRAALLACVAGLLVVVHVARPRLVAPFLPAIAVVGGLLLVLTPLGSRFAQAANNPRLIYWGALIAATLSNHTAVLIGHGVGSIGRFGTDVQYAGLNIPGLASRIGGQGNVFAVDNFFIRSFYETGMFGFSFLVWTLWLWWRAYRLVLKDVNRTELALPVALMAFVLGISLFTDSLGTYPWNMIFWLCVAGVFAEIPQRSLTAGKVGSSDGTGVSG